MRSSTKPESVAALRRHVYRANMELFRSGLVLGTFGNVSGADRKAGIMAIKPSGVDYRKLKPDQIVLLDLTTGKPIRSKLNPSSDTPTHLELYRAFPCNGIVHTHSTFATALAQCRLPLRCMGTTHADYFHGNVPVTRAMKRAEVVRDYEQNTGKVIVESFKRLDPVAIPGVLVANHGPFAWGKDATGAVHNAMTLEFLAKMDVIARIVPNAKPAPAKFLIDKHFLRKHGKNAYYGQKGNRKLK